MKRPDGGRQQSDDIFRLLVQSVKDYAIFMLDPTGHVASWNEGAQRIKGYTATEIIGRHFSAFYMPESVAIGWPDQELKIARAEGRFEEEGWRVRKDGSRFWANVLITAVRGPDGDLKGFAKVTRDLTERKRSEEELHQLNQELRFRLEQLAQTNRNLAKKTEENESFLYSVSHDVRSPLVNLQGFSHEIKLACDDLQAVFKDESIPEALRARGLKILDTGVFESVKYIQSAVLRLSGIVDALLRLSRVGRVEYQRIEVDVDKIVHRIVDSMNASFQNRKASVTLDELPPALGDEMAIEQVFSNLLVNAVKYLDPARPGAIRVGAGRSAEGMQIYFVSDNGLGMSEAAQAKVFTAFQRFHPEAAPGEGIGLALVHKVVERLKGKIWVASEEGCGTTFYLSLPEIPARS